jgi:hypothetical protein
MGNSQSKFLRIKKVFGSNLDTLLITTGVFSTFSYTIYGSKITDPSLLQFLDTHALKVYRHSKLQTVA